MRSYSSIFAKSLPLVLVCACAFPLAASAQSQNSSDQQSVADAARKARAQKQTSAKPARVITDDTISRASKEDAPAPQASAAPASAPAPASADQPSSDAAAPSASSAPQIPVESPQTHEVTAAEVAQAKQLLADAEKDLDLLKRQLALQEDSFYSNPDRSRDASGKAALDALQQSINEKIPNVEQLKARVAELTGMLGPAANSPQTEAPAKP